MEPSQVRAWLGPRASMGAIPAVNRTTCSLFSSPQSGYYTSYNLPVPNIREPTCNFIYSNVIYGGRHKGGKRNSVVADNVVPLYLTTITIRIQQAALYNTYNIVNI